MVITCSDCRFSFVPDLAEDIEKHREFHARWKEATLPVGCPSLKSTGGNLASALLVDHGSAISSESPFIEKASRGPTEGHLYVAMFIAIRQGGKAFDQKGLKRLRHGQKLRAVKFPQRLGSPPELSEPIDQALADSSSTQGSSSVLRARPPIAAAIDHTRLKF